VLGTHWESIAHIRYSGPLADGDQSTRALITQEVSAWHAPGQRHATDNAWRSVSSQSTIQAACFADTVSDGFVGSATTSSLRTESLPTDIAESLNFPQRVR
jgi:hypothetical protein